MPDQPHIITRRAALAAVPGLTAVVATASWPALAAGDDRKVYDRIETELVMNLVVTCTSPERIGGETDASKDGKRDDIWPIIGGKFEGPNIRGTVVLGGGDFPVVRPDGVVIIDALYRLKTDDGVTVIIHNKGLYYPPSGGKPERYRLAPEFIAPVGKYDWLNKSLFLSTLVDVPPAMALAKGPNENDRLIQVFRVD